MFQENRVDLGNCSTDDESGRFYMISPEITVGADNPGFLAFDHYFLTEIALRRRQPDDQHQWRRLHADPARL